jgi:hypothetical protein
MAAMPKPLEKVPAGFVAGSVVQRDGSAGERVVWVTVHRKGDECADAVAVPVMEHEGSYYVMAWALRRWSDWK